MTALNLHIVPGKTAPRDLGQSLELVDVYVTEEGTNAGLPIVDFVGVDAEGRRFFFSTTGRMVNAVAAAVQSVNLRLRGVPNP